MTGMGGTLGSKSPYVTSRFNQALWHQLVSSRWWSSWRRSSQRCCSGETADPSARRRSPAPASSSASASARCGSSPACSSSSRRCRSGSPTQVVHPPPRRAPGWVAAPGALRDRCLAAPPHRRRRGRRVDPAGSRALAPLRRPRSLVSGGGLVLRRLGALASGCFGNAIGGLFVAPISWMTGAPGRPLLLRRRRRGHRAAAAMAPASLARRSGPPGPSGRSSSTWRSSRRGLAAASGVGAGEDPGAIGAMAQAMGSVSQPGLTGSIQNHLASFSLHGSLAHQPRRRRHLGFVAVAYLRASSGAGARGGPRAYLVLALARLDPHPGPRHLRRRGHRRELDAPLGDRGPGDLDRGAPTRRTPRPSSSPPSPRQLGPGRWRPSPQRRSSRSVRCRCSSWRPSRAPRPMQPPPADPAWPGDPAGA